MPGGAGLDPRCCQAFSVLPAGSRRQCGWWWPGLAPCGVVVCDRVVVVPRGSVPFTMTRTPAEREQIRAALAARDMQISEAWVAGESVEGIARRYRLSYGRVSQIVHGRPDLRAERDRRQRAAEMRKRRSVQAWSSRHPGAPLAEAAALFGLDEAELKKILGERAPPPFRPTADTDASVQRRRDPPGTGRVPGRRHGAAQRLRPGLHPARVAVLLNGHHPTRVLERSAGQRGPSHHLEAHP